jgi:hypothetical protein
MASLVALPLSATNFYLTVVGLGGEAEYEQRFAAWAKEADQVLRATADAQVVTLAAGDATRAKVESTLAQFARQAKKDDALVVLLIGHGTHDGREYKFNVPGPDVTAAELGAWMDRVPVGRQLVVNTTSASGGGLQNLQRPQRVVICATKNGFEKNATLFARYFVEALRDPSADTDKNESVTALEAFRYAEQKTAKFYETQKRLATEHAVLEDTGAGEGVRDPSPANGKGQLAARIVVARLGSGPSIYRDPAKLKLLAQKEELEAKIDSLKYQKAALKESDYKQQLQALLLQLAEVQEAIEK